MLLIIPPVISKKHVFYFDIFASNLLLFKMTNNSKVSHLEIKYNEDNWNSGARIQGQRPAMIAAYLNPGS